MSLEHAHLYISLQQIGLRYKALVRPVDASASVKAKISVGIVILKIFKVESLIMSDAFWL